MSLDKDYLHYPQRHYGMDHELYKWSMLSERAPVQWPNDGKLALWVNVNIDFFPLSQRQNPVAVPGGMKMPYPDLRHFSLRDYGNRVGVYRIFQALDKFSVKPTVAINGAMVDRAPYLMKFIAERQDEVLGHGWQMDHLHHGEVDPADEAQWLDASLRKLRGYFKQPVNGWLSPGRMQSAATARLLVEHDIAYMCDWINDEMPYDFRSEAGVLTAMPLSNELDDFFIMGNNLHSEESYAEQLQDACDLLLAEAQSQGGRMLALNIHPWMSGQPHRIGYLEQALAYITAQPGVWSATASEIHQVWQAQQKR
ncbi:polysaccharide deacetylase family protein [Alteromonas sp. C1M14]|uniref:polysaccharide deacetylase family protein n=1 Tax=Alteromonas sp. C1M14 TaxID=2841567 RepID=UPI001C09928E|nr:polysaccharide deacetylase family protein [Alteromonas sp. C1M14]MBU2980033.1 polysaccharide deacetylase family protein [Alteromonas sp. C1M14]